MENSLPSKITWWRRNQTLVIEQNVTDSVLVSGFSFVDTADQMASIQAREGDAMLHHVVTISGDTTQGGVEGYSAIFSQLSEVHGFAPQAKTIDVITDADSGFKSTACPFGLMWASLILPD